MLGHVDRLVIAVDHHERLSAVTRFIGGDVAGEGKIEASAYAIGRRDKKESSTAIH